MEALREPAAERYEIIEQIAQGSMGAVYLARDLTTGDRVALKTLNEGGSVDDADLDRLRRLFLHEASAGSLLSHPAIVRIRDVIDEPGRAEVFLVMDYVEGSSLADVLGRPDPLPFDFVVNVVCEVAAVLDHVHAHGVVHRDIKPANILISRGGAIKVTDFGISELRGELAEELQRAGSPNYMAPERVLGTGSDYRADIWALGVVLYEMLTRRLPFQGESVAELVTRIAAEAPEALDGHGLGAIPGLQPIIDRALAKEPQDRYQFAGEIAAELKAVQSGQMKLSATLPASSIPEPATDPVHADSGEAPWASLRTALAGWLGWLLPWRRLAVVGALLALALTTLWLSIAGRPAGVTEEPVPAGVTEEQRLRFEYLALLEEARLMLERGEHEAAAELFSRAESLSPDAARIRALRDDARRQAAEEIAAEIDFEVAALVGIAEADLASGRLWDAADAVGRALELSPDHSGAQALAQTIEARHEAARVAAERARMPAAVPPPVAPPPPEPVERLRVEEPIEPPAPAPTATHSDLKIDFYSELPRGVVTVYRGESQVLRRPFRFVQKRGFMRTKGVSGGFDAQVRVKAGPSDFRIYLSLPGQETQVERLSGILPPGAIRALQVRVDGAGKLTVALH